MAHRSWLMEGHRPYSISHKPSAIDSEPDIDGERIGEPAQIDLAAGKVLVRGKRAFRPLILQFAAHAPGPDRHANAAEDDRTNRCAAAGEVAIEDRSVGREKLSVLAVVVVEYADTAAHVRLDAVVMSERKPADAGRERHDPQPQVLLDFRAVGVDEVVVHRRHRMRVVADAKTGVKVI